MTIGADTTLLSLKDQALGGLNALHGIASYLPTVGNFRPLRGGFSALGLLESGHLEGRLLATGQAPGPCPPGCMTERAGFRQNDHQPWPYFWTLSKNARLVGKMLHWRDAKDRLCTEGVYQILKRRRLGEDALFAQMFVPTPLELKGAWTSLTSPWNDCRNYYHWMLDGLTRLGIHEELPEKAGILLPTGAPKFAIESLRLLGLEEAALTVSAGCVRPERYYFCSPMAMTGVRNPYGYQWLREKFSPYFAVPESGPPVFLTRRGNARIPENLSAIEEIFQGRGYEIVDCASVTVRQQIEKLSGATAVAGLHGAAMTNLLWVRPQTPVMEIFEPGYLNGCYEQIAFHGGLDYQYLILDSSDHLERLVQWSTASTGQTRRR